MLRRCITLALVGCVASPVSEVITSIDDPAAIVTTDFTGGAACLDGPLVTPVYCTVSDSAGYVSECEGFDVPCWYAVDDAECASGFQIVVTTELPIATDAAFEAFCWSR
ncbi:MAG TPA: hypothetical protein VGG28_10175 [Kofleriaceae bacterium]|jgi:hypothetical protein